MKAEAFEVRSISKVILIFFLRSSAADQNTIGLHDKSNKASVLFMGFEENLFLTLAGKDQLVVHFSFKMREAKLRVNNKNLKYFDAKLRFAHFTSLRSAIFSETKKYN